VSVCTVAFPLKLTYIYFKPFHAGQNRLLLFQAIPGRPKLTFSILSHSSQAKTRFLYSKQFLSGQDQLLLFQAIPVRPKRTSSILCHSSKLNIVNKSSLLSLPCRNWSSNYSILVLFSSLFFHRPIRSRVAVLLFTVFSVKKPFQKTKVLQIVFVYSPFQF
jgi:hypothetical protein